MHSRGFTLVEVLVALSILCAAALGGLQLVAVATGMMGGARTQTLAASLASVRMEQLRSLRFEFDASGQRLTDLTTNLSIEPAGPGGGGLAASGPTSLESNVEGFVDFLDGAGRWLAGGNAAPPRTAFIRRWSIEPADPNGDLLVVQVLVRPVTAGASGGPRRLNGEARYVSVRARVLQ